MRSYFLPVRSRTGRPYECVLVIARMKTSVTRTMTSTMAPSRIATVDHQPGCPRRTLAITPVTIAAGAMSAAAQNASPAPGASREDSADAPSSEPVSRATRMPARAPTPSPSEAAASSEGWNNVVVTDDSLASHARGVAYLGVDEAPPGADEPGVDVRLVAALRPRRRPDMEPADARLGQPGHVLRRQTAPGHDEPRDRRIGVGDRLVAALRPRRRPDMEPADARLGQPGHVLRRQTAPGHDEPRDRRIGVGARHEVVEPVPQAARRPAGQHLVQAGQRPYIPPRLCGIERRVDRPMERPGPAAVPGELGAHLEIDLAEPVEESHDDAVGAGVHVGRRQTLEPRRLAAVRAESAAQPPHHPELDRRGAPYGRHQRRLGRQAALVHRADELYPVGTALGGVLGVRRLEHHDLEQSRHVSMVPRWTGSGRRRAVATPLERSAPVSYT